MRVAPALGFRCRRRCPAPTSLLLPAPSAARPPSSAFRALPARPRRRGLSPAPAPGLGECPPASRLSLPPPRRPTAPLPPPAVRRPPRWPRPSLRVAGGAPCRGPPRSPSRPGWVPCRAACGAGPAGPVGALVALAPARGPGLLAPPFPTRSRRCRRRPRRGARARRPALVALPVSSLLPARLSGRGQRRPGRPAVGPAPRASSVRPALPWPGLPRLCRPRPAAPLAAVAGPARCGCGAGVCRAAGPSRCRPLAVLRSPPSPQRVAPPGRWSLPPPAGSAAAAPRALPPAPPPGRGGRPAGARPGARLPRPCPPGAPRPPLGASSRPRSACAPARSRGRRRRSCGWAGRRTSAVALPPGVGCPPAGGRGPPLSALVGLGWAPGPGLLPGSRRSPVRCGPCLPLRPPPWCPPLLRPPRRPCGPRPSRRRPCRPPRLRHARPCARPAPGPVARRRSARRSSDGAGGRLLPAPLGSVGPLGRPSLCAALRPCGAGVCLTPARVSGRPRRGRRLGGAGAPGRPPGFPGPAPPGRRRPALGVDPGPTPAGVPAAGWCSAGCGGSWGRLARGCAAPPRPSCGCAPRAPRPPGAPPRPPRWALPRASRFRSSCRPRTLARLLRSRPAASSCGPLPRSPSRSSGRAGVRPGLGVAAVARPLRRLWSPLPPSRSPPAGAALRLRPGRRRWCLVAWGLAGLAAPPRPGLRPPPVFLIIYCVGPAAPRLCPSRGRLGPHRSPARPLAGCPPPGVARPRRPGPPPARARFARGARRPARGRPRLPAPRVPAGPGSGPLTPGCVMFPPLGPSAAGLAAGPLPAPVAGSVSPHP